MSKPEANPVVEHMRLHVPTELLDAIAERAAMKVLERLEGVRPGPSHYMTPAEAAELLAVSQRTVYRLVQRGHLVPLRIGACTRFDPTEVRAFVERSRVQSRANAAPDTAPRPRAVASGSIVERVRSLERRDQGGAG